MIGIKRDKSCRGEFFLLLIFHPLHELLDQLFILFCFGLFYSLEFFVFSLPLLFRHREVGSGSPFQDPLTKHINFLLILIIECVKRLVRDGAFMKVERFSDVELFYVESILIASGNTFRVDGVVVFVKLLLQFLLGEVSGYFMQHDSEI